MLRATSHLLALAALTLTAAATPAAGACVRYRAMPIAPSPGAAYLTADGRVRIVGYNDMAEMLRPMAELFSRHHPGFRLDLVLEGTRTAPPALTGGTSLIAPMGAEWEALPLAAYRARYGSDPAMIRVAHASLNPHARSSPSAVLVHKDNPLQVLSMAQVREIFTGAATDWTQLAQPARGAVHPVGFGETTAIGQFLRTSYFAGRNFAAGYAGKPQSRDVIEAVASDPQAIGIANLNHIDARVRVIGLSSGRGQKPSYGSPADIRAGRYPLDRHLLAYARRDDRGRLEPLAREWLKLMLSCQGQAIAAGGSLGYIPLGRGEVAREWRKLN